MENQCLQKCLMSWKSGFYARSPEISPQIDISVPKPKVSVGTIKNKGIPVTPLPLWLSSLYPWMGRVSHSDIL